MRQAAVKYRRPLNKEQLKVLELLYRFRFGTVRYIAQYLSKTNIKVVQKKLKLLEAQGYIAKRYGREYKLQGRPAEYYLVPKGARVLAARTNPGALPAHQVTDWGIKNLYKNPTVSEVFIAHCLNILKVALHFQENYGARLQLFSRMQILPFDYLPSWRPDLFLNLKPSAKSRARPQQFFLDLWDGTGPFFVSVRKARNYLTYAGEDRWPVDEWPLPAVLMLCAGQQDETKLRRQIRRALDESYEEVVYATATTTVFMNSRGPAGRIWREASDNEVYLTLQTISEP